MRGIYSRHYFPTGSQRHALPNGVGIDALRNPSTTVPTGVLSLGLQILKPKGVLSPGPVGCLTCTGGAGADAVRESATAEVPVHGPSIRQLSANRLAVPPKRSNRLASPGNGRSSRVLFPDGPAGFRSEPCSPTQIHRRGSGKAGSWAAREAAVRSAHGVPSRSNSIPADAVARGRMGGETAVALTQSGVGSRICSMAAAGLAVLDSRHCTRRIPPPPELMRTISLRFKCARSFLLLGVSSAPREVNHLNVLRPLPVI